VGQVPEPRPFHVLVLALDQGDYFAWKGLIH
jgi:hypothetical protein